MCKYVNTYIRTYIRTYDNTVSPPKVDYRGAAAPDKGDGHGIPEMSGEFMTI